jgi:CheY-like chemotaxis protein
VVNDFKADFDIGMFINEDLNDKDVKQYILDTKDKNFLALMSKENDEYENYSHIIAITFPLYCSKLKDKFLEFLNPSKKHIINQNRVGKYNGNVLVVEDNEANQELIKILLQKYGLTYDVANNGLEAYDLYRQNNNYDLILMDEQMPIMDGNKAVAKILNYEKNMGLKHTPVSALTANVIKGAKERGLKSGFDSFLGKPIVIKELEKVLNLYLKADNKNKKTDVQAKSGTTKTIVGLNSEMLMKELMLSFDELTLLLEMFLKKMTKLLPEFNTAIESKNLKEVSLLAHSIKGSSANFRIKFLQDLAYEVEKNAKSGEEDYDYKEAYEKMSEYVDGIKVI